MDGRVSTLIFCVCNAESDHSQWLPYDSVIKKLYSLPGPAIKIMYCCGEGGGVAESIGDCCWVAGLPPVSSCVDPNLTTVGSVDI